MVLRHRQKLWQRVLLSWFTILALLIISILLGQSLWDIYQKSRESTERADFAKLELSKLQERKEALDNDLNRVKSTAGIEAELRDKFDVAKEGEHLLVIVDKEIEVQQEPVEQSWLSNLWHKVTQ